MLTLTSTLNSLRRSKINSRASLLFKDNIFTNEVYLFYPSDDFDRDRVNVFLKHLKAAYKIDEQGENKSLIVDKISFWAMSSIGASHDVMHITDNVVNQIAELIPQYIFEIFSDLSNQVFDTCNSYTIIKIVVNRNIELPLKDLLSRQDYFKSYGLNIIYNTNKKIKLLNIDNFINYLYDVKQQKSHVEKLIINKLKSSRARLKGIRSEYKSNNIDIEAICIIYEMSDIDIMERDLKDRFISESTFSGLSGELESPVMNIDVSLSNEEIKVKAFDTELCDVSSNHVETSLLNESTAGAFNDSFMFRFCEHNNIIIEVSSLKTFDAFDFQFFNNKLIVTINSNHVFYTDVYLRSSEESQKLLEVMISSLCHLSHINLSEVVQKSDRKLFSRWSECIEEYILGDSE